MSDATGFRSHYELCEAQAQKLQAACDELEMLLKRWRVFVGQNNAIKTEPTSEAQMTSCSILPFKRPNQSTLTSARAHQTDAPAQKTECLLLEMKKR